MPKYLLPRPKSSRPFTTPASRCRKMLLLSARLCWKKHEGDYCHKPGSTFRALRMASLCISSDTFDMRTGLSATKAPDTQSQKSVSKETYYSSKETSYSVKRDLRCAPDTPPQKSVTRYIYYIMSLYRGLTRTQAPPRAECSTDTRDMRSGLSAASASTSRV